MTEQTNGQHPPLAERARRKKTVLTTDQREILNFVRDLEGLTYNQARYEALTLEQREQWKEQTRLAERARRAANPRREMLLRKKHDAKNRGIEFTITEADLDWPDYCPVTGIKLRYDGVNDKGRRGANFNSATIDRIDNERGYVPGNVVIVSFQVNTRKGDATLEQLRKNADFYNRLCWFYSGAAIRRVP